MSRKKKTSEWGSCSEVFFFFTPLFSFHSKEPLSKCLWTPCYTHWPVYLRVYCKLPLHRIQKVSLEEYYDSLVSEQLSLSAPLLNPSIHPSIPPPPLPLVVLSGDEDHWRGKISSSGPARIYSCFGVSSEICALCQRWWWSRLYTSAPTGAHQSPPLLSHCWRGKGERRWRAGGGAVEWRWWSLRLQFTLIRQRDKREEKSEVGLPQLSPLVLWCLPAVTGCQGKSPKAGYDRSVGEGGGGGVHTHVCAYMFSCCGFHISHISLKSEQTPEAWNGCLSQQKAPTTSNIMAQKDKQTVSASVAI